MIKYITFFEDISCRYTSIITAFERIGTLQDEVPANSKDATQHEALKRYIIKSKRVIDLEKDIINEQIKQDASYVLEIISLIVSSIEYETFAK